jgi:hypothetical protein
MATPPPPVLAAVPVATAPPRPQPTEPAREPEPPPPPPQEPEPAPAPEPPRPAREPEPAIAAEHHYTVRRGIELDIAPYEAEIFVNGRSVGNSERWDDEYVFDGPGRYLVRFVHPGHRPTTVEVTVNPSARRKWVEVEVELEEIED